MQAQGSTPAGAAHEVELHQGDIDSIRDEWDELFAADPQATPFVSSGWARAWWPHWAGSAKPWLLSVREGGRLIALAPLVIRRRGPFRVLGPLGRDPANYWDVIVRPDRREPALAAVADGIAMRRAGWDALAIGGLPEGAPIVAALEQRGLHAIRRDPVAHPGIELPESFDAYLSTLPGKRRKDLGRHLRRLDSGQIQIREIREPAELGRAVATWQELRQRWWAARGRSLNPEHASVRFRQFLRDAMAALVPAGLGLVWELRHQGKVVGIEISLVTTRCFYAWLDGYDPDVAHLGLGKVAVTAAIRSSIAAGRERFDFMVGAEAYKYSFGATDRYCRWVMLTHGSPRSRASRIAGHLAGRLPRARGGHPPAAVKKAPG